MSNIDLHENPNGTWSQAIPLPFYGIRKHCYASGCKRKFWRESKYREHYEREHLDKRKYQRTPTGMVEVKS